MIFGSVCSGIEAASVAWAPLGFRASFLSEIATFPRAVLKHHYQDTPLHGDFTTIKAGDYRPIGLQLIPETATTLRARDGAKGVDSDCTQTLLAFGGNNTSGPIDVATALNACHTASGRQDFASETFITHTLRGEGFDASEDGTGRGTPIVPVAYRTSPNCGAWATGDRIDALTTGTDPTSHIVSVALRGRDGGATAEVGDDAAFTLRASAGGADKPHILTHAVRRLTPLECERLMGFPDGYSRIPIRSYRRQPRGSHFRNYPDMYECSPSGTWTRYASDGPRYMALGNSMAVPVMRWLGARIAAEDAR